MIILRDYQLELIEKIRTEMRKGYRSICAVAPTGSGKTALSSYMLKRGSEIGKRSWFIVHRKELIEQSAEAFDKMGVKFGIVSPHYHENPFAPVQICSIQTLSNRYPRMKAPDTIIYDECHHLVSKSWIKIKNIYTQAYHIGLTATPMRLDGKGLGEVFDSLVEGPNMKWLIENGHLSNYRVYAPSSIDRSKLKTRMGDYKIQDIVDQVDRPTITGDAIKEYMTKARGKRAIVFCASVEHSKHVVQSFNDAGIRAMHVDAKTPTHDREKSKKLFAKGEIKVLSNVDLFGEGYDVPALEVVILLRPTKSLGLYMQQVGRSLRPVHGKDYAIILDHVGNVKEHGLPDEAREWSLLGRFSQAKNKSEVKTCPKCFGVNPVTKTSCQYCGTSLVGSSGPRQLDQVEGELEEFKQEDFSKRQKLIEQARCKTVEELAELGKKRGYVKPYFWAKHVFNARQKKRIGG